MTPTYRTPDLNLVIGRGSAPLPTGTESLLVAMLQRVFRREDVCREWSIRDRATDTFRDIDTYAPRLDIAVGPFNVTWNSRLDHARIIRDVDHPIVGRLLEAMRIQNDGIVFDNPNPRCLIGIEIEKTTSTKHILGAITNASMLGRLGVIVTSETYLEKVQRIHTYVRKLREVGKASRDMFCNVACFEERQFLALIR